MFNNKEDQDVYLSVVPLYFPRTRYIQFFKGRASSTMLMYRKEELVSREELPRDVGNEFGETVIEERKIRISAYPSKQGILRMREHVTLARIDNQAYLKTENLDPERTWNSIKDFRVWSRAACP